MSGYIVLLFVLLLIASIIVATHWHSILVYHGGGRGTIKGGRKNGGANLSPHIVVDTLNLAYYLHKDGGSESVAKTIRETAANLRDKFPGKVIYVLKNNMGNIDLQALAVKYKVHICTAEKYIDPPAGNKKSDDHSARGRDDFYCAILAARYKCTILTDDNLRDFKLFRGTLQPFYVIEYNYYKELPEKEYITPQTGYIDLRRPKTQKNCTIT